MVSPISPCSSVEYKRTLTRGKSLLFSLRMNSAELDWRMDFFYPYWLDWLIPPSGTDGSPAYAQPTSSVIFLKISPSPVPSAGPQRQQAPVLRDAVQLHRQGDRVRGADPVHRHRHQRRGRRAQLHRGRDLPARVVRRGLRHFRRVCRVSPGGEIYW